MGNIDVLKLKHLIFDVLVAASASLRVGSILFLILIFIVWTGGKTVDVRRT